MQLSSSVIGEIGRLLVSAELLRRGYSVSRPEADVGHDIVSISPSGAAWRLQIKARSGYPQFVVRRGSRRNQAYSREDADGFVFAELTSHRFWIIPIDCVGESRSVSMKRNSPWLSAWGILDSSPCPIAAAISQLGRLGNAP